MYKHIPLEVKNHRVGRHLGGLLIQTSFRKSCLEPLPKAGLPKAPQINERCLYNLSLKKATHSSIWMPQVLFLTLPRRSCGNFQKKPKGTIVTLLHFQKLREHVALRSSFKKVLCSNLHQTQGLSTTHFIGRTFSYSIGGDINIHLN